MKVAGVGGRDGVLGRRRAGSSFVIAFSSFLMLWLITERQIKTSLENILDSFCTAERETGLKLRLKFKIPLLLKITVIFREIKLIPLACLCSNFRYVLCAPTLWFS